MMNQVEIFEDFPYVILELLGTGSYAKVYRAKSANDPLQEAVSDFFKSVLSFVLKQM
jgi:serine/threonine protein kinase